MIFIVGDVTENYENMSFSPPRGKRIKNYFLCTHEDYKGLLLDLSDMVMNTSTIQQGLFKFEDVNNAQKPSFNFKDTQRFNIF